MKRRKHRRSFTGRIAATFSSLAAQTSPGALIVMIAITAGVPTGLHAHHGRHALDPARQITANGGPIAASGLRDPAPSNPG